MKYIIFMVGDDSLRVPVLFSEALYHAEVGEALIPVMEKTFSPRGIRAISAGFYDMKNRRCSGESSSMQLVHHAEDESIIGLYYGS